MPSSPLHRAAGPAAVVVAVGGVLYSVLFVIAVRSGSSVAATASWLVLLVVALVSSAVLVVVYQQVREADPATSLWALVLAVAGVYGSVAHAGYALASESNRTADVASQADPRGLATFGITGLALLAFAVVIRRAGVLPAGLGTLGLVFGGLLVLTYLGRLIIVDPNNPALLGVGVLAVGWAPRATTRVVYGLLAWSFLLEMLASAVDVPEAVRATSLLHHVALAPAVGVEWGAVAGYAGLAVLAAAVGVRGFVRRDLRGE